MTTLPVLFTPASSNQPYHVGEITCSTSPRAFATLDLKAGPQTLYSAKGRRGQRVHFMAVEDAHDLAIVMETRREWAIPGLRLAEPGELAAAIDRQQLPGKRKREDVLAQASTDFADHGYALHEGVLLQRISWEPALAVGTRGKKEIEIALRKHEIGRPKEPHIFRADERAEAHAYAEALRGNTGAGAVVDRARVTVLDPAALTLPRTEDPTSEVRKKLIGLVEETSELLPERFAKLARQRNLMALDDEAFAEAMSAALRRMRGIIEESLDAGAKERTMSAHLRARILRAMAADQLDER